MTGKRLSSAEKEQIENRIAEGATPGRIAGELGRSHHTIQKYAAEPDAQEQIAGKLQDVALRTVSAITDKDISRASLVQKLTGIGIAIDKLRLIRGQPTQINVSLLMDMVAWVKAQRDQE